MEPNAGGWSSDDRYALTRPLSLVGDVLRDPEGGLKTSVLDIDYAAKQVGS